MFEENIIPQGSFIEVGSIYLLQDLFGALADLHNL